jgi:hypothetical protein
MAKRELRGIFLSALASVAPMTFALGMSACSNSDSGEPTPAVPDAGKSDPCEPSMATPICRASFCVAVAPDAGVPPDASGEIPSDQCKTLCADNMVLSCEVVAPADSGGDSRLRCQPDCTCRAPEGLVPCPQDAGLGGYFAEMARLEAASVVAFRRLAHELRQHGAPLRLRRAARRAARDEVRHARLARELTRRFGGTQRAPSVAAKRSRSLLGLLLENAAEGTVREAFGALAASWQSRHASDESVRRVMSEVFVDETRHAELALGIEHWATRRLTADERAAVADARAHAVRALFGDLERDPPSDLTLVAGAPSSRIARALATALERELWTERRGPKRASDPAPRS